jgi:hypothetical protein
VFGAFPRVLVGTTGAIRWAPDPVAYYTAAAIEGYRVSWSTTTRRWSLTATVVLADAFKMAQRPLVFVAKHRSGAWAWPIDSLTLTGLRGPLTATLGSPMELRR